jgi:hypothetical protein
LLQIKVSAASTPPSLRQAATKAAYLRQISQISFSKMLCTAKLTKLTTKIDVW